MSGEFVDKDFSKRLSKALDQALGMTIVNVVYSVLNTDFGTEKELVTSNLEGGTEKFSELLERIFSK